MQSSGQRMCVGWDWPTGRKSNSCNLKIEFDALVESSKADPELTKPESHLTRAACYIEEVANGRQQFTAFSLFETVISWSSNINNWRLALDGGKEHLTM